MSSHQRQPSADTLEALRSGSVAVVERLPWSSNFTFLVNVEYHDTTRQAIYKPVVGEQPLWDFPRGLYKREVAAYELSIALGWPNVPPTVARDKAPFGSGSLQLFVDADFEQHYFTFIDAPTFFDSFLEVATFDVITNNADRKSGHCLRTADDEVWVIDHGLCFNTEPKLRTVIWEFASETIPPKLCDDMQRVADNIPASLRELLSDAEIDALVERMRALIEAPVLPSLASPRQYPYPLI